MMRNKIVALGLVICFVLVGAGCGQLGNDCWPELRAKHAQFYLAIDSDLPLPGEIDDSREELRNVLKNCSPDTSFSAYSSGEDQIIESYITLLDLAILADDVELAESFLARLESDPAAVIETEKLDYGGLYLGLGAFAESSGVVEWLLVGGADPNESEESGLTALHASQARTESGLKVIRDLVAYGADVERSVGNGHTPVMSGRQNGDLNKVQCLIALGARVPEESELIEVRGLFTNHGKVQIVDDFLMASDRSIPKSIIETCSSGASL
jgi:hypothetical protein